MLNYGPLQLRVSTPRLELVSATDDLLEQLEPLVREGKASADPAPYDDPMSLYEEDPTVRVNKWLRGIWRARGVVTPGSWRLSLAVVLDAQPVGMQDLIGVHFDSHRTVVSFSWLSADVRGQRIGHEMRHAVLHLAFAGLGAMEASSDAFLDNVGSNRISAGLGYEKNGVEWATRRGKADLLQRWRLTRENWLQHQRSDIHLRGVSNCIAALGQQ